MATRPAAQHIALDTLIARAQPAARPASAPKPLRPAPRTLADLERASSLASAPAQPATTPIALALWITVATCTCGRVHRLPPHYALAKYSDNEHSFHYARSDLEGHLHLPREIREKPIRIPFCEKCFEPELLRNSPTGIARPSIEAIHDNGHGTYLGPCPECAELKAQWAEEDAASELRSNLPPVSEDGP